MKHITSSSPATLFVKVGDRRIGIHKGLNKFEDADYAELSETPFFKTLLEKKVISEKAEGVEDDEEGKPLNPEEPLQSTDELREAHAAELSEMRQKYDDLVLENAKLKEELEELKTRPS